MGRAHGAQYQRHAASCPLLLHNCTMLHAADTRVCRRAVNHHHTLLTVDRSPCMLLPSYSPYTLQALGGPMAVA